MAERLNRSSLVTEQQNPSSMDLDSRSVAEILEIINREDCKVAEAVHAVLPQLEEAVNLAVSTIKSGHHVIYVGAGTSGRLGVLDAAECPPTFSAPPDFFQGVIAGGEEALRQSIEGAEDKPEDAERDLKSIDVREGDVVIGIASSGRTPYVLGFHYLQPFRSCFSDKHTPEHIHYFITLVKPTLLGCMLHRQFNFQKCCQFCHGYHGDGDVIVLGTINSIRST